MVMIEATSDLWWKSSIVYCLDVETYLDWSGDGYGDFDGLTRRLDYLQGLGITCLWLMPFYPSPSRDDGYDVVDFYGVDPALGHLGEFTEFMRTAADRGIKVVVDLVVNHTSDQHPWFKSARSGKDSPFHDYYVWSEKKPKDMGENVFPDAEEGIWSFDEKAGAWYLHNFYHHQPDLNVRNPTVRDEMAKVVGFWLAQGIAGFRVDAVPFLVDASGVEGEARFEPHDFLKDMRAFIGRRRGDAVLMGEVNLEPEDTVEYFGRAPGDELNMVINFYINQYLFLSLARGSAEPLGKALQGLPPIPPDCQWAYFVRNHDELTLDKLTEEEREEVFALFAPEEDHRLFGRGIRRRLPTMLGGDEARIRMAYSLLFSLPGTPVLFYGEEIGMAENLDIEDRMSVRSPMQWTDEENGGFSQAPAKRLRRPLVEGPHGPSRINVAAQRQERDSMLNWMERVIRRRKETPEFGWGEWRIMDVDDSALLVILYDWQGSKVLAAHNFGGQKVRAELDLGEDCHGVQDLLGHQRYLPAVDGLVQLELAPYGYQWLRSHVAGQRMTP
jgi:trehalose synthase